MFLRLTLAFVHHSAKCCTVQRPCIGGTSAIVRQKYLSPTRSTWPLPFVSLHQPSPIYAIFRATYISRSFSPASRSYSRFALSSWASRSSRIVFSLFFRRILLATMQPHSDSFDNAIVSRPVLAPDGRSMSNFDSGANPRTRIQPASVMTLNRLPAR